LEEQMSFSNLWIDIETAPLMRVQVAKSREGEHSYLLIQQHHLITDHVSQEIILEEIHACLTDQEASLSSPMPYRNFVAHTLAQLNKANAETYFQSRLGDIEEVTAPFNLVNVHGDGSGVVKVSRMLDAALSQRIRRLVREWQVSPATLFHMAWGLVVSRCSAREEVVFGTMMSGRLQGAVGSDRILGMFLNMLPLRLSVQSGLSVTEYLRQTHEHLIGLLPFEQVPLSTTQRCSGVASGTPLFSAILNYRHSGKGSATTGGLSSEVLESGFEGIEILGAEDRGNYPFDMSVDDLDGGFAVTAQIDSSVDASRIVGYVCESIGSLIESLSDQPERLLRDVSMQPSAEREHLLVTQVEKAPDALALSLGTESLTYSELNVAANRLAHDLLAKGVKPGELVGVYQSRSLALFVSLLGIMKAGGAYVMLDPDQPVERVQQISRRAELSTVLSTEQLMGQLGEIEQATVVSIDSPAMIKALSSTDSTNPSLSLSAQAPAFAYFTSGSTGVPKGALNSHEGAVNAMLSMAKELDLTQQDRVLQFAALGFDVVIEEVLPAWFSGASVVLRDHGV